jgi:Ca2+-binding RTX toxin-like protein
LADASAQADAAFSYAVPANAFTDADAGDELSYSARQSNGQALPSWLHFDSNLRTFSGTPTDSDSGTLTVQVIAADSAGASASSSFALNIIGTRVVAQAIADQGATQEQAWNFAVPTASFRDRDTNETLTYSATLANGDALPSWLTFNTTTKTFSGTPHNGDVGSLSLKVTAVDSTGVSASAVFGLAVANVNDAPVLTQAIGNQAATEDQAWTFALPDGAFADPDLGDTLTYTATLANGAALPTWLHFDAPTRTFSGTPANGDVGSIGLKVVATDAAGASASSAFTVAVANVNDAPFVDAAAADLTAAETRAFSASLPMNLFGDVDLGDALAWSVQKADGQALPAWLIFDAGTRTLSGTPAIGNGGRLALRVTVTDTSGASINQTFNVDIDHAPVLVQQMADQVATQGQQFNVALPGALFADADANDSLTFTASLSSGAALPAWLTFDSRNRTFSGTPANADVGVLGLRITATDAQGLSANSQFALTVANVNDTPTVAHSITSQSVDQGAAWSLTIAADVIADIDVGDTLTYGATLADGSALPAWLHFNAATRVFSGTPLNGDVGAINVKVIAADSAGATANTIFSLTVINTNDAPSVAHPLADQSATEDATWSFAVPANTFTDIDTGDTLSYSATLANGSTLPAWLSFNAVTGVFSGTPQNGDVGTANVKVIATDAAGASVSSAFVITVVNTNDAPTLAQQLANQSVNEDSPWAFVVPANTFADVDVGDSLTYSATLRNGSALPSWLSFNSATRTFSGIPANADVGNISLKVSGTDVAGATASSTFSLVVINTNDAPTVAQTIANQTATEDAAWSFTVPSNTFADVDVGDSLTYAAALANGSALPSWLAFNAATRTFSGTPLNGNVGSVSVKVVATDIAGASANSTFTLTVANTNDAPTVEQAIANQSATEDLAWSFTVSANTFADVDVGDMLAYSAKLGDGSALPSWLTFNAATRTFSGTPLNSDVGNVSIKVFATDVAGASATSAFTLTVANTNDAPVVSQPVANQNATQDQAWTLTVPTATFTDVDVGDTLVYSATLANGAALPSWLAFNAATRTFSGTPRNSDVGSLNLRVIATDIAGANANTTFALTVANVNDAPTAVGTLSNWSATAGTATSYTVPVSAFNDIDVGDTLAYSATLSNGAALPSWLTFNAATRVFSGTPGSSDGGNLSLKVIATDTGGLAAYQNVGLHVDVNLTLYGTSGTDTLIGGVGNDYLDGLGGADQLRGAAGDDTYVVDNTGDAVVENANEGQDTILSSVAYTLPGNVENLTLTGTVKLNGTGNALDNLLTGNSDINRLSGAAGNDTLDGGAGIDTLIGGTGDDTYVVDSTTDTITENSGEGTDLILSSVTYNMATLSNVENLTLAGAASINATGNSLANALTGNGSANSILGGSGDDTLSGGGGNDTLDGGAGNDRMLGGSGDDQYAVADAGDVVVEQAGEGIDTVVFNSNKFTYVLPANVENLGALGTQSIAAMGNSLDNVLTGGAGVDTLSGAAGNDTLDGGASADSLSGGLGDDTYYVDTNNDVIVENAGEGADLVFSSNGSYTLPANVENLTLLSGATNGVGNALNNVFVGNSGVNQLTGGAGNDSYVLSRGGNADKIIENDATLSNADVAVFGADIAFDQLWFSQNMNDLEVTVIGTGDEFRIQNWFLGSQYHVEQFKSGDGKTLLDSQVQNLVNAMASFSPPAQGQTTLPANYQSALGGVLAANWN